MTRNIQRIKLSTLIILFILVYLNNSEVVTSKYQKSVEKSNFSVSYNHSAVHLKCYFYEYNFKPQIESLKQWKRRRRVIKCDRNIMAKNRMKRNSNDVFKETLDNSLHSSVNLIVWFKKHWPVELWEKYMFSEDYIDLINRHWLQFSPPDNLVNYFLGGLYIVLMLVGCSGNGIVIFMYFKCQSLRTPGNILVANLALSDFLMLAKTPVFIFNSFNLGPALGKTGCVVYGFLGGLTGCTSIATLAAIALDRYWAIARPLEGLRTLTAIRAKVLAVTTWIYACIFASVPALDIGYGRYVPEGYLTSCSFDYLTEELPPRYFIFTFFCAAWVLPFSTITICYVKILRVVLYNRNISTTARSDNRLSSRHVKEQVKKKAEMKLAILVIAVIGLFFVSWTPYAIVALLGIFGRKDLITPTASMIPALFCKTAACINPFIYIITHPKFRKEINNLLFRDKSKRQGSQQMKTMGYTEAVNYNYHHRSSKDLSDTDVQVVEMKDIPFHTDTNDHKSDINTVSGNLMTRHGSVKSSQVSMKSFEEDIVAPPSWFAKPEFARKKSFHSSSLKNIVSYKTDSMRI